MTRAPLEWIGAGVAIVGLMGWVALAVSERSGDPDGLRSAGAPLQDATEASGVPCAVPLAWRVARVDPEFGLTMEEARRIARRAAGRWEEAVDGDLFVNRPDIGFPVRFVYDDRQARTRERLQRQEELQTIRRRLQERRRALEEDVERHERLRSELDAGLADLRRRLERHNERVRSWNDRGGAPEPVADEIRENRRELDDERRRLAEREREIDSLQASIDEASERHNREVQEHRERVDALSSSFPGQLIESGRYREAVHSEDGRITSVEREIRIYRYDDRRDLERVIAHELGHSLGLEHVPMEGALMSEQYGREGSSDGSVQPADLELLRDVCPEL